MPTELEELVEFLHHGNTQIRQLAIENLVGYSTAQPSIFKDGQLTPIKDLKLLVRDYAPIAKNALTILINLSTDNEILKSLSNDDAFIESLLSRITNPKEPTADLIAMLLANLVKSDDLVRRILTLNMGATPKVGLVSKGVMDRLMDCFVRGAEGGWNKGADFDYLAWVFADVAKHPEGRRYFVTKQAYDDVIPITKLIVFTEHKSDVRRKGVASTIKNVSFEIPSHPLLLSTSEVDILPYLLLPLAGAEEYPEDEMLLFPPSLQLLAPDKSRDKDPTIITTHLETLLILTTTRHGREIMRGCGVYPLIRECHLHIEDDDVRDGAERLVQVLMRDEENGEGGGFVKELEEDEDDKIVDVF
ncbi:hypothetical protein FGG08_002029 [Glutinoglossum americanum]|uniref:Protein HGH1 homolog n=1 Tax=Glutinoglossum americanum TaxID=1670608 RepID=A0A9P8IA77_9PEZI|nr:hypothetical protein FGG08_002029 [Glutinoglossum americanum]